MLLMGAGGDALIWPPQFVQAGLGQGGRLLAIYWNAAGQSAGQDILWQNPVDYHGPFQVDETFTANAGAVTMPLALEVNLDSGYLVFSDLALQHQVTGYSTIQRSTYSVAGQSVAVKVAGDPDGNNGLFFLYSDHLGSANAMQHPNGEVTQTRYLPFGGYRGGSGGNPITDRGYTGHKHNDSLGLIYMNARYYSPYINRFVSADSIVPDPANPQSFNRYSYVRNNPLSFTDPTGHRECGDWNGDTCTNEFPHETHYQQALIRAWIFYEDNFVNPFEGRQNLSQEFGPTQWDDYHDGVDWSGDFTARAPFPGTVTEAGLDAPAGMWRLRSATDPTVKREWFNLKEEDRDEVDGLLEPERLLATGEWIDDAPDWSHTQGTIIRIDHGHNLETVYYHTNPSVAANTTVNQGDALGETANNGWSTGTHLHYTVNFTYNGGSKPLNPLAPPASIQHLLTP